MSQDKPQAASEVFVDLVDRIKALDKKNFQEISVRSHSDKPKTEGFADQFHESWKDGGRFSEGFGKSPAD